jgi:hypothetical protein
MFERDEFGRTLSFLLARRVAVSFNIDVVVRRQPQR